MKKILNVRVYTQIIIYLFAVTMVVHAQPPRPPSAGSGPGEDEVAVQMEEQRLRLFRYLRLLPEQKEQLDANRAKHYSKVYMLQQEIKVKRDALRVELERPQLDVKKAKDIHAELKALYCKIEDIHLEGILGLRQILTPEQFGRFMEFSANMRPPHPLRGD